MPDPGELPKELLDEDALIACVDLAGRSGATGFQIGYLHDEVPVEDAAWFAYAQYRGARLTTDNHRSVTAAVEAFAELLLTGAKCKCGRLVTTSADGAFAFFKARTSDGKSWNAHEAAKAGQCRWRRVGRRWTSACEQGEPRG